MVTLTELLANLPPEPGEASLFGEIEQAVGESKRKLVVIDDDPTGTQTVHDIELLTTWNRQMLVEALQNEPWLFYLLTNSRSMPESEAVQNVDRLLLGIERGLSRGRGDDRACRDEKRRGEGARGHPA